MSGMFGRYSRYFTHIRSLAPDARAVSLLVCPSIRSSVIGRELGEINCRRLLVGTTLLKGDKRRHILLHG
jgi:hypothetical protein